MSEKKDGKPQQAKPKYKSAGQRRSGGAVPSINASALQFDILHTRFGAHGVVPSPQNGHTRKALALIRRAAAHA